MRVKSISADTRSLYDGEDGKKKNTRKEEEVWLATISDLSRLGSCYGNNYLGRPGKHCRPGDSRELLPVWSFTLCRCFSLPDDCFPIGEEGAVVGRRNSAVSLSATVGARESFQCSADLGDNCLRRAICAIWRKRVECYTLVMQISAKKLNKTLENQIRQMLVGVLCEVDSPKVMEEILADLLTETERVAMMKRMGIAIYLDKSRSYEDIKNNLKVSSATIATVAEGMGNPGVGEVIKRIKAEEWASDWTEKISRGLRRILPI